MATADTRLGHEFAGYRIEALLGRGGMGVVYRASDPELHRPVALKVIAPELAHDPAFKARFLEEIEVAASLEHPHVCPVYRAGESQGELYVCMRLLDEGTLASTVASQGPLVPSKAAEIVSQLASALDLAHARSLLHRDVKAENVLLDREGNAYLCDFGLAGAIWQQEEQAQLAGTLAYLAPERCEGSPAIPASDLYALACLAYVLLSGDPPFVKEHEAALLYAHLREEPPSLASHGLARADPVLAQALAKDPASRYESCAAFAHALASALARPERPEGESWPETLPRPATRLVGRQAELAQLRLIVEDAQTRLCTLTGPGGTGKTRLALQVGAESAETFPDGVHWVSLAPLRDPAYALSAIAQALDISEQPPASLEDTLAQALAGKDLLLVLDNAEHLLPEIADDVARLRDIPAGPTLLCTSRERLDLQAERLYPVPSLAEQEAAELFSDRASYLDPAHDPADPAIATLCERLDALPLALELAAARSDLYSPEELLGALEGHLELLKGARDHDPRHQTLHATIAWSYELLTLEEQSAFRALSVFAGGCNAEAAQKVAGADPALLQSLVRKSLLRTREAASGRRFVMLETVRQYAAERLEEVGEGEAARERHADFYYRLAIESEALLEGSRLPHALECIRDEYDNYRAATSHSLPRSPRKVVEATIALRRYWLYGGAGSRNACGDLLAALDADRRTPRALRARALLASGTLCVLNGEYSAAMELLGEAVDLFRSLADLRQLASALNSRGVAAQRVADRKTARSSWEESMKLYHAMDDNVFYGRTMANLGTLYWDMGDIDKARSTQEEALALLRNVGRPFDTRVALANLAQIAIEQGSLPSARAYAGEALEIADVHGDTLMAIHSRSLLALCDLDDGELKGARMFLVRALADCRTVAADDALAAALYAVARYLSSTGEDAACLRILGAADRCMGASELHSPMEHRLRTRLLEQVTVVIGSAQVEQEIRKGREFSRQDAIEYALGALARL